METIVNSDCDQSSSQDGDSRPTSGVGSYEDDFERELECQLSCGYDDEAQDEALKSDWAGRFKTPVVLNHSGYRDCDEDLEDVLTSGLAVPTTRLSEGLNGHFYEFERDFEGSGSTNSLSRRFRDFFKKRGHTGGGAMEGQGDNFFDAAEEVGYDSTPDSGVHENLQNMDPAQRARQEEEWRNELAKTEEEIQTLKAVLDSKIRHSQSLKRKLGITVWKEFRDDMEQGLKNVKESEALKNVSDRLYEVQQAIVGAPLYQKTESAIKTAGEKTTTVLGTFGASVSKKLGEVKNSSTFKSFEEKVGSAYTNVKTKVSGSRSNSVQSFEEALANTEGRNSSTTTPATTPVIPEEKPLS